ncbi:MAG: PorT family protein [Flavobacteriales bacterium]|nr:PorT family protein [Flavobacteriales bacterium]
MKKIIFCFCLIGVFAQAQNKSFGAKAGFNIASVKASADGASDASDARFGLHFGLFGEFKVSEKFAIQPEVLFNMQGGNATEQGQDTGFRLNYIAIPVMFKFYTSNKFSLELGPQFGFLADSSVFVDELSVDGSEVFNSFDLNLGFGLNYEVSSKVFLSGRYTFGITNIASTAYQQAVRDELNVGSFSLKNSNLQFGLGYRL